MLCNLMEMSSVQCYDISTLFFIVWKKKKDMIIYFDYVFLFIFLYSHKYLFCREHKRWYKYEIPGRWYLIIPKQMLFRWWWIVDVCSYTRLCSKNPRFADGRVSKQHFALNVFLNAQLCFVCKWVKYILISHLRNIIYVIF